MVDKDKTTITLKKDEVRDIAWILDHFSDYVGGDDRLDHGWNLLKKWRELSNERKIGLYMLAGKLKRKVRKLSQE